MCYQQGIYPVAVKYEDRPATLDSYQAHVATGCGEDLPAILGLISMQEKDSVIMLRKGKEVMAFPGPGGYKIEWSPGAKLLPLEPAPSGHLVIPCDRFSELDSKVNNREQVAFWTDFSNKHPESE